MLFNIFYHWLGLFSVVTYYWSWKALDFCQLACYPRKSDFITGSKFHCLTTPDGMWGDWTAWPACDRYLAVQTRSRECNNPSPMFGGNACSGPSAEQLSCTPICLSMAFYLDNVITLGNIIISRDLCFSSNFEFDGFLCWGLRMLTKCLFSCKQ